LAGFKFEMTPKLREKWQMEAELLNELEIVTGTGRVTQPTTSVCGEGRGPELAHSWFSL
jgi:hypothetical protein